MRRKFPWMEVQKNSLFVPMQTSKGGKNRKIMKMVEDWKYCIGLGLLTKIVHIKLENILVTFLGFTDRDVAQ